jgi:nucleotide-binding universal stress UspA family protein
VADLGELDQVDVRQVLREGHPAQTLPHEGEGADLLVVGTRGLAGLERLRLGSTSRALLHHAYMPLAIIPDIIDVLPDDR